MARSFSARLVDVTEEAAGDSQVRRGDHERLSRPTYERWQCAGPGM
jgi:hypothetical protein